MKTVLRKRVAAFGYAFSGLWHLFSTQRHAQFHLFVLLVVVALGALLRVDRLGWALLIAMFALVIALEAVNTAIEAVVDLASPDHHALAKIAKDVGAAAVLWAALGAVLVGLLVLGPPLLAWLGF